MQNDVSVDSGTHNAIVFVLEDHEETSRCIYEKLSEHGKVVTVAKTLPEFESILKEESETDVCSIDWTIKQRDVGAIALSLAKKYEADSGKLVYTGYPDKIQMAYEEGADFALEKVGENYDDYAISVEKAAQLGLLQKITSRLNELGGAFNKNPELEIFNQARQKAFEQVFAGEDDILLQLLKRRGWWKSFDPEYYSNLSFDEKVILLFDYVDAKEDEVAEIFQSNKSDIQDIFIAKKIPETFRKTADEILSILAYLLRISSYEPELMPYYWQTKDIFQKSFNRPPWDSFGLNEYLRNFKSDEKAVEKSLYWIRSN